MFITQTCCFSEFFLLSPEVPSTCEKAQVSAENISHVLQPYREQHILQKIIHLSVPAFSFQPICSFTFSLKHNLVFGKGFLLSRDSHCSLFWYKNTTGLYYSSLYLLFGLLCAICTLLIPSPQHLKTTEVFIISLCFRYHHKLLSSGSKRTVISYIPDLNSAYEFKQKPI